jgi:processive rubber oxygenase RoxA-like protein
MDGMFLRAPYLHNASVLTLAELINLKKRRDVFYRGHHRYDPIDAGYRSPDAPDDETYFKFDTSIRGNSNMGHEFPLAYDDPNRNVDDLTALLDYLNPLADRGGRDESFSSVLHHPGPIHRGVRSIRLGAEHRTLWPETTHALDLNQTKAAIWAASILLIPALSLYPFEAASTRVSNLAHLYWSFAYLAFLLWRCASSPAIAETLN